MVGAHVPADRRDDLVVGATPSNEAAFATNDPGHVVLLEQLYAGRTWQNVGVTLAPALPSRIQLCGPTVIEIAGQRVDGALPGRQGRVLFAYLAVNRHRLVSRDELAAALWPDAGSRGQRDGLQRLLSKLRKAIAPSIIDGRSSLRLLFDDGALGRHRSRRGCGAPGRVAHRARGLQERVGRRHWPGCSSAEREFLPGRGGSVGRRSTRPPRRRSDVRALEAYAAAALGTGGTEVLAAVRAGRQLVRLDPLRETGYQILMQALTAQGQCRPRRCACTRICAPCCATN